MFDVASLRPADEGPAGELGAVVGTYGAWIAAKTGDLVQHPRHVTAADAVIDGDVECIRCLRSLLCERAADATMEVANRALFTFIGMFLLDRFADRSVAQLES